MLGNEKFQVECGDNTCERSWHNLLGRVVNQLSIESLFSGGDKILVEVWCSYEAAGEQAISSLKS